jgi:hypothetical protein
MADLLTAFRAHLIAAGVVRDPAVVGRYVRAASGRNSAGLGLDPGCGS